MYCLEVGAVHPHLFPGRELVLLLGWLMADLRVDELLGAAAAAGQQTHQALSCKGGMLPLVNAGYPFTSCMHGVTGCP